MENNYHQWESGRPYTWYMIGTNITASIMMNIINQLGKTLLNSALYQVTQKEESTFASSQTTTELISCKLTHFCNKTKAQIASIVTTSIYNTIPFCLLFMSYFTLKTKNQRKHLLVKEIKRKIAPKLFASTTDSWKHATVSVKTLFDEALLVPVLFSCYKAKPHQQWPVSAVHRGCGSAYNWATSYRSYALFDSLPEPIY